MAIDAALLRSSFDLVVEREPVITTRFYEILFERYPSVRPLFSNSAPAKQQEMLQNALVSALEHLEDPAWLEQQLGALGAKHVDYGVTDEMYGWVGECLLATLAEIAEEAWTDDVRVAWTEAYGAIAGLMQRGASA